MRATRLFLLLALLALPVPASATPENDCEWHRGICYRPLKPLVSAEQAAALRDPATLPAEPLRLVTHSLTRGQTEELPSLAPPLWEREPLPAAAGGRKATNFTAVTEPWDGVEHRKVVKLFMSFPGQFGYACSGSIVGSRTVLTAGHCVYNHDEGGYATSIVIQPAMYGSGRTPYGEYEAADITTTNWWVNSEDFRGDIAVIRLDERAGDLTGSLPVYDGGGSPVDGRAIRYMGYPGTAPYDGNTMYEASTVVDDGSTYLLCHDEDLIQGMSGGPALAYLSGATQVVGVNSYCAGGGWWGSECCHVAGGTLWTQMIADFEAVATPAPTGYWDCPLGQYSGRDGCHCGCGVYDPDCGDATAAVYGCPADGECVEYWCDFNGSCRDRIVGGPCDDGDVCTGPDYCISGSCRGSAIDCDDGNPCTRDSCHPTLGCRYDALAGACDDGDPCTLDDTCAGGACVGTARDCDDDNPCTTDYCTPAAGCRNVPNSDPCDDGDACTVNDYCQNGVCRGPRADCDDGNPCTQDTCDPAVGCQNTPTDFFCDDGSACTYADQCDQGRCVGIPFDCDDGDPCTADSCDPAIGCVHTEDPSCSNQVDPTPVPDAGAPIVMPDAGSTQPPGGDAGGTTAPPGQGDAGGSCQAGGATSAGPLPLALLLLLMMWRRRRAYSVRR